MTSRLLAASALALLLHGCASANVVRTSQDTAIIQVSAAPACGGMGAAQVAQKEAAKATLKSGYDRYIIYDAAAANNVSVSQGAGSYQTNATVIGNSVYANTSYVPGPVIYSGSHDQSLAVKMFKDGQPGASNAISARDILGPQWATEMKRVTVTCTK